MTITKLFAIAALATTALVPLAMFPETAVAQPARKQADFKTAADAILADAYPADGPGAAVIVTRGGAVVYSGGRGLADVEAGEAITADNVFRLGSIAKQFTAAVVLQLVEEGKLSLDDPVSRFFPDYPQPGAHATVRQLLNHTSGIQDLSKIPGWIPANYQKPHTTAELLAVFRDLPAKFEPGTDWEYNNGGYILLGAIVEEVTGNPWHEEVADRITGPLGLETIVHNVSGKQVPAAARGYTEADGRQQVAPLTHLSVPHAAGGLIGSPADLAEWSRALHRGRVVGPELYREMISAARLADGSTEPYGFGLRLEKLRGHKAIVHGGAIRGFSTDSVYISSEDVFVGVFANSDDPAVDPTVVMVRLAAMAIGEPFPAFEKVALGETEVDPLLGLYSYDGGERRFFRKDRRLFTRLNTNQDIEVFAAGNDRFFYGPTTVSWFAIERNADGRHVMRVHQGPSDTVFTSVRSGPVPEDKPVIIASDVLRSYTGTYKTSGPGVTIAMAEEGQLTVELTGNSPLPMRAIAENEFRVDRVGARIVFHDDGGRVDRLTVHHRGRELQGRREQR